MRQPLFIILIFTLLVFEGNSQTVEEKVEDALSKWIENPSIDNSQLDLNVLEQFKDSGRFENEIKEGKWIEYELDTSMMGETTTLIVGDKQLPMTHSAKILKKIGSYLKGQKSGSWTTFESYDKKSPFFWTRTEVCNYKDGKKHGEEIVYQGYGEDQSPVVIRNWDNGFEYGIGKVYDLNYPYKLKQVFFNDGEKYWLLEQYYPEGQLEIKYTDSIVSNQELKFMQAFFENGNLEQTGFYTKEDVRCGEWIDYYSNGQIEIIGNYELGNRNGFFEYYFENGQLWTECEYKNGLLWNVKSNFNSKGEKREKGTLKNGTGTFYIYDMDGKLTDIIEFKKGETITKKGSS
ncbi:hypothetical protein GM418_13960 [Maribellus comscasis]|uniref:Toxin-antitoxin system YwqK family antitoxin n=1 Tax=Maribellus comscasis TaxID=2681766 RepID=A0A6I6JX83_9BACT|nr:hypothetical protein [Maribellus comscasis]QGY44732.1 hypothetical protein GM418_13960 [Maribellus comscasis]